MLVLVLPPNQKGTAKHHNLGGFFVLALHPPPIKKEKISTTPWVIRFRLGVYPATKKKVFRRYVASASAWHSRLVRFFQAQAPSPRRCEELPWHLNKCYRWHPLKNSLVDLKTFEASPILPVSNLFFSPPRCVSSFFFQDWSLQ